MAISAYQQILVSFLGKLSLDIPDPSGLPDRIGICFDSDTTVNVELLSQPLKPQIVLTGRVGSVADFGTFFDVCALVAKGNFYLSQANGCTLSVHEESQTVYVQYAFPLLTDDLRMIDVTTRLIETLLIDLVEFIRHVRLKGLT